MDTVATMKRENSGTAPILRTYAGIRGVTLSRETLANGGATLDLSSPTLALASNTSGYYVGGATKALVAPLEALDTRHYQYALKAVYTAMGGRGYMGTWNDAGTVYMEGVSHYESLETALMAAGIRGELAIWDIAGNKEIRVSE